jgi:hypothetical protein
MSCADGRVRGPYRRRNTIGWGARHHGCLPASIDTGGAGGELLAMSKTLTPP